MNASEKLPLISVFIAEDHLVVRSGVKIVLRSDPAFSVIGEAENGEDALNQIRELQPQVALVDIGLPCLDGIALSQKLHESSCPTKIVMFTSHSNPETISAAFAAGVEGYCLKEATDSQIKSAIKSVAAGAFWLHPQVAQTALTQMGEGDAPYPMQPGQNKIKHDLLTEREHQVLELLVGGSSNQQIADSLYLSLETVKTHVRRIFEKLAVSDRTQAALKAVRAGWIE